MEYVSEVWSGKLKVFGQWSEKCETQETPKMNTQVVLLSPILYCKKNNIDQTNDNILTCRSFWCVREGLEQCVQPCTLCCLMRVPVLIQKHGWKCKQVLLLGSFFKTVLLANSAFWQAGTRSAIQKCIHFLYKCVFLQKLTPLNFALFVRQYSY